MCSAPRANILIWKSFKYSSRWGANTLLCAPTIPERILVNRINEKTIELSYNSTGLLVESWLFCIQYFPCSVRMFLVQTSTPTSSMYRNLSEHGKFVMPNNQLPPNTPVELKDNFYKWNLLHGSVIQNYAYQNIGRLMEPNANWNTVL